MSCGARVRPRWRSSIAITRIPGRMRWCWIWRWGEKITGADVCRRIRRRSGGTGSVFTYVHRVADKLGVASRKEVLDACARYDLLCPGCISSSRCFVFSHVFFSGLGSCMHFPYFSGCAEVFLPNMRASLTRRLWPVNSRSRPWCTMRSMIAAASLSSAKTVPHLLNSMFVVNMMLRLS